MRAPRLFAYGTLRRESVQRRVFGRAVPATPAELAGWRVVPAFVRSRYPGIVVAGGRRTRGGLLALRPGELKVADAYEESPRLYRRRRVTARAGRIGVRCWIYVPSVTSRP